MKKILSLALVLAMVLTMSVTAFAAEIKQDTENKAGTTEVTHTVSDSYIVTIPDSMTIGTDANVSVKDVVLASGKELTVSVSSKQYNDGWKLKNGDDTIGYTLKIDNTDVANNGTVLTAKSGETANKTLKTELSGTAKYSGSYTDTLTFSVSVASSSGGTTETWTTVTDENGLKTALEAGGKVKLGADIELENQLNIYTQSDSDLTIVLDLNGYTITDKAAMDILLFFTNEQECNLKVTIKDTSVNQTGKITGISTGVCAIACINVDTGSAEITVEGGTISGSVALSVLGNAKAVINAGTLCSNAANSWALSCSGPSSSAVINGGTIKNTVGDIAIYTCANTQTLKITDGEITGKIYVYSASPAGITITGGTYSVDPTDYVDTNSYTVTNNTDGTWTVSTKTSD